MALTEKEKIKISEERRRILAARQKDKEIVDPMIKVRFSNIENPGTAEHPSPPLSFSFGRYRFKESRDEETEDTALRHNQEYVLPLSVVNHLNSLSIPVYGHVLDPVTRVLKTVVTGVRNRFSCVPVDAESMVRAMDAGATAKKAVGDPKADEAVPLEQNPNPLG